MTYRKNDVVRWVWSKKELKRRNDGNNCGTTYWCKSQTAIFDGEEFVDTYWNSGSDFSFRPEDIGGLVEVRYIANLDYYELQGRYVTRGDLVNFYKTEDILDLSHPNNTGQVYLKKGAKKDLEVIREALQYERSKYEREIESAQRGIERLNEWEKELTKENCEDYPIYF